MCGAFFMTVNKRTHLKTIGILLSYLLVILGYKFLHWSPLGFFVALYLELVVIIITYIVLRILDKSKNPKKYRKLPDISNIIVALAGALLLQYVFMQGTLSIFHPINISEPLELMNDSGGWIALITLSIVYLLSALDERTVSQKEYELQQNLFLEILALSGMNLLGIVLLYSLDITTPLIILLAMFAGRAGIEIYFQYKTGRT